MATTATHQNPSPSLCDDRLKSKSLIKPKPCTHCGAPFKFFLSDQLSDNPTCQSCDRRKTDISTFYFIDFKNNLIASPRFGKTSEAQQFAVIFGMNGGNGYAMVEELNLFDGHCPELDKDKTRRQEVFDAINWGSILLKILKDRGDRERYAGETGLRKLADIILLTQYALPMYRVSALRAA